MIKKLGLGALVDFNGNPDNPNIMGAVMSMTPPALGASLAAFDLAAKAQPTAGM